MKREFQFKILKRRNANEKGIRPYPALRCNTQDAMALVIVSKLSENLEYESVSIQLFCVSISHKIHLPDFQQLDVQLLV